MNRVGRAVLMLLIGVVTAGLLRTGGYGWFVQQRMFLPMVGAAVVLLALGVYESVRGILEEHRRPEASRRAVAPSVGWFMVLPLIVLVAVAPTALGAAAANRVEAYTPTQSTREFAPLDDSAGAVDMRVYDFLDRAVWDADKSLDGTEVRLEGLVVNDAEKAADGFLLTRFLVSCCAADGIPLQVALRGSPESFEDDTWVSAVVRWRPPDVPYTEIEGPKTIEADVVSLTVLPGDRKDPYESPY